MTAINMPPPPALPKWSSDVYRRSAKERLKYLGKVIDQFILNSKEAHLREQDIKHINSLYAALGKDLNDLKEATPPRRRSR